MPTNFANKVPETDCGAPLTDPGPLLPDPLVQRRYRVTSMTIWRWDHCPELNFPKPIVIAGRKYRYVQQLLEWELQRAKASAA
jgi:hypothetical protein